MLKMIIPAWSFQADSHFMTIPRVVFVHVYFDLLTFCISDDIRDPACYISPYPFKNEGYLSIYLLDLKSPVKTTTPLYRPKELRRPSHGVLNLRWPSLRCENESLCLIHVLTSHGAG
jgi:hypothetical protein